MVMTGEREAEAAVDLTKEQHPAIAHPANQTHTHTHTHTQSPPLFCVTRASYYSSPFPLISHRSLVTLLHASIVHHCVSIRFFGHLESKRLLSTSRFKCLPSSLLTLHSMGSSLSQLPLLAPTAHIPLPSENSLFVSLVLHIACTRVRKHVTTIPSESNEKEIAPLHLLAPLLFSTACSVEGEKGEGEGKRPPPLHTHKLKGADGHG